MKDPLDMREDAYQRFNEEAKEQGKPLRLSPSSRRGDIVRVFGQLQIKAKNRAGLQQAFDRLTRVEQRAMEDIFFYSVEEVHAGGQPLPEPAWGGDCDVALPEPDLVGLLVPVFGDGDAVPPVEFRAIVVSSMNRYEEAFVPTAEVEFEK